MTNTESGATVPEGTAPTIPSRPQGICLIEIWISSDKRAPSHFWREMQADGTFSLWRFMEPAFAKKALRAKTYTLDKDQDTVTYAARRVDVRELVLDDYERVKKLREAFRSCPDPRLLCKSCQGSKEIQATQRESASKVRRFVTTCPECAPKPTEAELIANVGTYTIVEEVPGIDPAEKYFVRAPDGLPLKLATNESANFRTIDDARQHLRLMLVPDECVKVAPFEP